MERKRNWALNWIEGEVDANIQQYSKTRTLLMILSKDISQAQYLLTSFEIELGKRGLFLNVKKPQTVPYNQVNPVPVLV